MPIDVQDSAPLYLQIVDDLKSKITSKELKAGDQLGSQAELSATYDVSLITVKKALATLINEGIIFSRVGKGTVSRATDERHPSQKDIPASGSSFRIFAVRSFHASCTAWKTLRMSCGYHVLISNSSGKSGKGRRRRLPVSGRIWCQRNDYCIDEP